MPSARGVHREIDDAAANERPAIGDPTIDGAVTVRDLYHAAKRPRAMRAAQFAGATAITVAVIRGQSTFGLSV
jgi:hypothetical protein